MMPFIMGNAESIPEEYKQYLPMIDACKISTKLIGQVGYLTITETVVKLGETQRKPGIHTDSGYGLIYMANNLPNSCRVWDEEIYSTDPYGDCEEYRDSLGKGITIEPNILYMLNENCPHESLPVEKEGERQFFRLVTGPLQAWWEGDSTPNRLKIVPPSTCEIKRGHKFKSMEEEAESLSRFTSSYPCW
ncbi:MAG: hypothetical protein V4439_01430 [Patescibacteria group bacterium]